MPPDPAKQIVERIAALLKRSGHGSKVKLAAHCGVDPTHVSHWLKHRRLPGPKNQLKLVEFLKKAKEQKQ